MLVRGFDCHFDALSRTDLKRLIRVITQNNDQLIHPLRLRLCAGVQMIFGA